MVREHGAQLPEALHAVEHPLGASGRASRRRCGRRRGTRPGRRRLAATGSWVTITMVWPSSSHGPAHEVEDLGAGAGVEVAGGLVGEDDLRPAGQGPGHRDPLLLAARQLARAVRRAGRARPTVSITRVEPRLVGLAAGEGQRQRDVLVGGERRHQVEGLEDEADLVPAQLGELLVVERRRGRRRRCRPGPTVSVSRPARQCISVDLPEPDGPMMAVKRPALERRR